MMRRSRRIHKAKPVQLTLPLRSSLANNPLYASDRCEVREDSYGCVRPKNDALDLGSVSLRRRRLTGAAPDLASGFKSTPKEPVTLSTVVRDACRWSLKTARCVAVVFW